MLLFVACATVAVGRTGCDATQHDGSREVRASLTEGASISDPSPGWNQAHA
jgi:hypothetical protein